MDLKQDPQASTIGPYSIVLSAAEVEYYGQLWETALTSTQTNTDGFPYTNEEQHLEGSQAAAFLARSGFDRLTLHTIWGIADKDNTGTLNPERFAIACRLIAHAQAGLLPHADLINCEPSELPRFAGIIAPEKESFDIQVTDQEIDSFAAQYKWLDTQKIGVLEGNVLRPAFESTKLPAKDLAAVWDILDIDGDGKLNMFEFIAGMTIASRLNTMHITKLPTVLPPSLNPVLIAQRYHKTHPIIASASQASESNIVYPAKAAPSTSSGISAPDQVKKEYVEKEHLSSNKPEDVKEDIDITNISGKKKKATKKQPALEKKHFKTKSTKFPEDSEREFTSQSSEYISSSDEYLRNEAFDISPKSHTYVTNESALGLIEGVIETDKRLAQLLAKDINVDSSALIDIRAVNMALRNDLHRARSNLALQIDRKRECEAQLNQERELLYKLNQERKQVEFQAVGAHRDIVHYQTELLFLRQQIAEIETDIQSLTETNNQLASEIKHRELEAQTIDAQRKSVLESVNQERKKLQTEEREINDLKSVLARLSREKANAFSKNAVLGEQLRQAAQDEMMQRAAVDSLRTKESEILRERVNLSHEKMGLVKTLNNISKNTWLDKKMQLLTMQADETLMDTNVGKSNTLLRDAKGIKVGGPATIEVKSCRVDSDNAVPSGWLRFSNSNSIHNAELPRSVESVHSDSAFAGDDMVDMPARTSTNRRASVSNTHRKDDLKERKYSTLVSQPDEILSGLETPSFGTRI